ncbi:UNVERIFIED_CONTAM: hypothetical protein Sradi_0584900 [Sesamum radiatum]|uniref:DUF7950 domain-containing protein n=1 Tax=Sesamum radiatum TaxID=300843 RepID=A0AAW2VIL2_SESRA
MDQRGGCCIARYAGGVYDMSKVDRIMLRFRPIAPKPASTNGSLSGGASSGSTTPENSGPSVKTGRGKRRHAGKDGSNSTVNKRNCNSRRRKSSPENTDSGGSVSGGEKVVKTLPLLPEDRGSCGGSVGLDDPTAPMGRMVVVGSWVKVECVTDTWVVGCYGYDGIGRTDEERVRSLDLDTCPGFISDGLNRVRWTNAAYRKMVAGEGTGGGEVAAWLVVEEGVTLPVGCTAFTCRVKVVTCGKEKNPKTVPCDVWRMDCGGFAWRLDTTAALSLGR